MASITTAATAKPAATTNKKGDGDEVREQDRFLPIANISRIMKKSLPPNAKIAKDAKETVQCSARRPRLLRPDCDCAGGPRSVDYHLEFVDVRFRRQSGYKPHELSF